jgi:3-hydroxyisobutyrate dehydrogenase-like beta-hydroxyacid dehydrogenase
LMGKDLALALDLAATHGVAMPATAIAQQMNHAAHAALKPGEDPAAIDYSLVIRLMARLAGLDRS